MCIKSLTFVDDHLLQLPFGRSPLKDLLIDGVDSDQAVHHHGLGLANPVAAVLSLQVSLGVLGANRRVTKHRVHTPVRPGAKLRTHPVTVKNDDGVGGCQVYPQASSSGAQQEEEHFWIFAKLGHLSKKECDKAVVIMDK